MSPFEKRVKRIDRRCARLARESAGLYHQAVTLGMPLETISAVARLSADIAAIHNRIASTAAARWRVPT